MPCGATQDERDMVESSEKNVSTEEQKKKNLMWIYAPSRNAEEAEV